MVESVQKSLDLLLTLLDFAVKFVTVALKLFLLLGGLDNVVSLRVFTLSLDFTTAALISLDETLVLDSEVLDLVVALLQLNLDLMALLLSCLQLTDQDVLVHLDFFLTLLHGHLELILAILETVDLVSACVDFLTQALDLKLHDVVLHESLLLLLYDRFEVTASHLILKLELTDDAVKSALLTLDLHNDTVDVATLILQLLVGGGQKLQVFLCLLELLGERLNLLGQLSLLLLGTNTLHAVDFTLHLLDLEVLSVD